MYEEQTRHILRFICDSYFKLQCCMCICLCSDSMLLQSNMGSEDVHCQSYWFAASPLQSVLTLTTLLGPLAHGIESAACLVPGDLVVIEGLVDSEGEILAIWLLYLHLQGLAWRQARDIYAQLVERANFVVVSRIRKRERQHALLLQVGLVDTSKALGDDSYSACSSPETAMIQGFAEPTPIAAKCNVMSSSVLPSISSRY